MSSNKKNKNNNKSNKNVKKKTVSKNTKENTKVEEIETVKISNNKANLNRGIITFSIGVILLILCLWSMGIFNKNTDSTKFYNEYASSCEIEENNLYVYASKEEVLDLLDHKTGVIYFGFSTCPWCQTMVPVLDEVAKNNKIEEIYYYNIKNDRDELSVNEQGQIITDKNPSNFYSELLKELDNNLSPYILTDGEGQEVDTGEKRIYVPLVVFVKEGRVVYTHEATVDSQDDPKVKLNKKQKEELVNYYNKGFSLIK